MNYIKKILRYYILMESLNHKVNTNDLTPLSLISNNKGICVFFTGLSGSGKTTLAQALESQIIKKTQRKVSILDGDEIRAQLCKDLSFSREDRIENIRRLSFVASHIVKHNGICICSPIAPYEESRILARTMIQPFGRFVLVHLNTSLDNCEKRDPKGLYIKARTGEIPNFTGINDPYENVQSYDLQLDTAQLTINECVERILALSP